MTNKQSYVKPESENLFLSYERSFCGPSNPDTDTNVLPLYDPDEIIEEKW